MILRYGFLMGILTAIYKYIDYLLGYQTDKIDIGMFTDVAILIVPLLVAYLGVSKCYESDVAKTGDKRFKRDVLLRGLGIVLVGAILSGAYMYLHGRFVHSDYLSYVYKFIDANSTEIGDVTEMKERATQRYSLWGQTIRTCLRYLVAGPIGIALGIILIRVKNHSV